MAVTWRCSITARYSLPLGPVQHCVEAIGETASIRREDRRERAHSPGKAARPVAVSVPQPGNDPNDEIFCSIGELPALTLTRPISTMRTAITQSVRLPQRNRFLLRPIAYYRHYGPAAWIDPVVLSAITISWNNIVIPVRNCPYHGHPDDRPFPWFTNDFGLLRMRRDTKRPRVTQHQGRSESERYGHYPHALASLPHTA
jgi:hypothetical protein